MKQFLFLLLIISFLSSCSVKYYDMNGNQLTPPEIQWCIASTEVFLQEIDTLHGFGQIVNPYYHSTLYEVPYYRKQYFNMYDQHPTFPKAKGKVTFVVDTTSHQWYLTDKNHYLYPIKIDKIFQD